MAVITALTAQNTCGVRAIHVPPAEFIGCQIDMIFEDIEVSAVKIGMLATVEIAGLIAERLAFYKPRHIVLDPVLAATSGDALASSGVAAAIRERLFPLAALITPNLPEAGALTEGLSPKNLEQTRMCAEKLHTQGAQAVLIKGGHAEDAGKESQSCEDILYDGSNFRSFSSPRVKTANTHGTGCTLSSAIAAFLAHGLDPGAAIEQAKAYVTRALVSADRLNVGGIRAFAQSSEPKKRHGPLDHFFVFDKDQS